MKVLHIAPTPFFSDRGCHIRVLSIIQSIETFGVANILCTYPLGRDLPDVDIRRISAVSGYSQVEAGPQPGKIKADIKLLLLGLRTALKEKPDVIHAHLHEGVVLGWIIKWLLIWRRIPLVADLQGGLVGELEDHGFFSKPGWQSSALRSLFWLAELLILKLPAHIFCSSINSEKIFLQEYKVRRAKITRLDDRVDLSAYDPDRKNKKASLPLGSRFIVVFSGSLLPIKGLDVLQHVILQLCRAREDIGFLLIGYPTDVMQRFMVENKLETRVELVGRVAFESLPEYLLSADVGIEPKQSSSGEGSGKLLHYMAAGLAIAAFPTKHNQELADKDAFAKENSATALAQHIEQLADNPARCHELGKQNREKVEPFSLESGGNIIARVYRDLNLPCSSELPG